MSLKLWYTVQHVIYSETGFLDLLARRGECKPSGILSVVAVEVDGILCSSHENPEATVYMEEPCVIILLQHVEICRVALDPRW